MNELQGAEAWIVERLSANSVLSATFGDRIHVGAVPQDELDEDGQPKTLYPAIVYSLLTAPDAIGSSAHRVLTRPVYVVKIIDEGESFSRLARELAELDVALTAGPGTAESYDGGPLIEVRGAIREQSVRYRETASGRAYVHMGGQYRLTIYPRPA